MNKKLLVSGADGQLGRVVCAYAIEHSWDVVACCHSESSADIMRKQGYSHVLVCDVTKSDDVERLFQQHPDVHGIAHLVGGIKAGSPIDTMSPLDFNSMLQINLVSTFMMLRYGLDSLKRNGGSFIGFAAKSAIIPQANRAAYSAAKAGVLSLCLSAAEECRDSLARVNVIVPSTIRTPANLEWATNGEERAWVDPIDIAACILNLCSDEMKALNGCVLPLYGGVSS